MDRKYNLQPVPQKAIEYIKHVFETQLKDGNVTAHVALGYIEELEIKIEDLEKEVHKQKDLAKTYYTQRNELWLKHYSLREGRL